MQVFKKRHHGMAYLMVMLALSVAGIIGVATISSTALAVQASATHQLATQAEFAATSGTQIALFGLQNPSAIPTAWKSSTSHALRATNIALDPSAGSCDLDASNGTARDTYSISTTGRCAADGTISRGLSTLAKVIRAKPTYAAVFGGAPTINSNCTFTGPVLANGTPTFSGSGTINGSVTTTITPSHFQIPTLSTINYFDAGASVTPYTMPDGVTTGTPESLAASISTFPAASATNPGHIFYRNGDLAINTTTTQTLNGTLIVRGNLSITGVNGTINVTPVSRLPAVIASGTIKLVNKSLTVKLNGVVWSGLGIAWTAPSVGTSLQVNGCLLVPSGAVVANPISGTLAVKYVAASVDVPDMATTAQPVTAVRVLSSIAN